MPTPPVGTPSSTPIVSTPSDNPSPATPALPGTGVPMAPIPELPGAGFPVVPLPADTSADDAALQARVVAARQAADLTLQGQIATAIGIEHTNALKTIMNDPGGKLAYNILLGISEACAKQPEDSVLSRLGPVISKVVGWDLLDEFA